MLGAQAVTKLVLQRARFDRKLWLEGDHLCICAHRPRPFQLACNENPDRILRIGARITLQPGTALNLKLSRSRILMHTKRCLYT